LSLDWEEWFDGMGIQQATGGVTILAGWIQDQAALHGCLARLRNLNLALLSVSPADPPTPKAARRKIQGE
jgi:hypothetical protein